MPPSKRDIREQTDADAIEREHRLEPALERSAVPTCARASA